MLFSLSENLSSSYAT